MKEITNSRFADFIANYEIGTAIVNGREVYYSNDRIPMSEVPEGFYRYEVRSKDNGSGWATIENSVIVNFAATIITDEKIPFTKHAWFNPFTGSDGVDDYCDIESYEITEDFWDDDLEMWDGGYSEENLKGYEIVCWPESQDLMEVGGYRSFCYLINDEEGLEKYGSSAYVVDAEWYATI